MPGHSFETICELVMKKNCEVVSDKKDYTYTKGPLSVKYECGHIEETTYNCFMRKTVMKCKKCIARRLSESTYDNEQNASTCNVKEYEMIEKVINILEEQFDVLKMPDACTVDIIIRPKNTDLDVWLPLQLVGHHFDGVQYTFRVKDQETVIICFAKADDKYWLIPRSALNNISFLSIGKRRSKYSQFEMQLSKLNESLQMCFTNRELHGSIVTLGKHDYFNLPRSKTSAVELAYRELRYNSLKELLNIEYPLLGGSKTDCCINGLKVQDKLAYQDSRSTSNDLFKVSLGKKGYAVGDNDLYWIHIKQHEYKNKCVIIPESYLLDDGKIKSHFTFRLTCTNPIVKYVFDYVNFDKSRFDELIASVKENRVP